MRKEVAAQPAPVQPEQEPVTIYQTQHPDGSWLDRDEQVFLRDKRNWCNTRILYATPPAQPEQGLEGGAS